MPGILRSVAQLLLAVTFLELGSGLQGVLVPVRAQMEGFPIHVIGLLGTAYYVGFVAGCIKVPHLVQRVGHIRAFSGFAALAAAAFLLLGLVVTVPAWLALRLTIGFCFASLWMTVESWLNARATTETRGRILATYMIIGWLAVIGGNLVFAWSAARGLLPFALVSIGICLAVLPVSFTSDAAPDQAPHARLRIRELYKTSAVGLVGCLSIGATNGAFWSLAPVYAGSGGLSSIQIGLFMSAAVLGGAAMQWPLGRWSDLTDRRRIIAVACLGAVAAAVGLILRGGSDARLALLLSFLFGASALPLYSLCVAQANDRAPTNAFVEVSSDLLMMFGVGAICGPYLAALLMTAVGRDGLFLFTAVGHLTLAAFTALHMRRLHPVPASEKAAFVGARKTTQAVLPLDPRAEPPETGPPEASEGG